MNNNCPDTLYHYSSQSGFCGIISSRDIRLGGIRRQRDPAEFVCGLAFTTMVAREKRNEYKGPDRIFLEKVEWKLRQYRERLGNGDVKILVCSFSEYRDRESLWMEYGANGAGVTLVLDGSKISSILQPDECFDQCIYEESAMRSRIFGLLDENRNNFQCMLATMGEQDAANRAAGDFQDAVMRKVAPFLKFGYEEEGEWRLVFDERYGEVIYPRNTPSPKHIRSGNPPQTLTVAVPLNDVNCNLPLREVIIGKHSPLSDDSIRECLRIHNIKIDPRSVWRSDVSCHS